MTTTNVGGWTDEARRPLGVLLRYVLPFNAAF